MDYLITGLIPQVIEGNLLAMIILGFIIYYNKRQNVRCQNCQDIICRHLFAKDGEE